MLPPRNIVYMLFENGTGFGGRNTCIKCKSACTILIFFLGDNGILTERRRVAMLSLQGSCVAHLLSSARVTACRCELHVRSLHFLLSIKISPVGEIFCVSLLNRDFYIITVRCTFSIAEDTHTKVLNSTWNLDPCSFTALFMLAPPIVHLVMAWIWFI